jgi:hypothetical protein
MPAKSLEELFDPESAVEGAFKHIFYRRKMPAFGQRELKDLPTPRLDLQFELGAATGHRGFDRRKRAWLDAWAFQLTIGIATEVNPKHPDGDHAIWRARVRITSQYAAEELTPALLPFHTLTQIQEAGTTDTVTTTDDCHISEVRFTGIVSIRSSAWPEV